MIAQLRSVVGDLLRSQGLWEVYDFPPQDVSAVPCIVLGLVNAVPSDAAGVFDRTLEVYVIGRQVSDDAHDELDKLADQVILALGGTQNIRLGSEHVMVNEVRAALVTVASSQFPAYVVTVESPVATCPGG